MVYEDDKQGRRSVDLLARALGYEPWNYGRYMTTDGRLLTIGQVIEEVATQTNRAKEANNGPAHHSYA